MPKPVFLEYFPPWYQLGDPDYFFHAVIYGFVALATIWLLEYICELILFSTAQGILLSDAAAHIALNNSNWLDIARWVWSMDKNSRLCLRAFMALIFRCVLVGIDLGILMQAVPHDIYIYENMVGGTELSFSSNASTVPPLGTKILLPLCKADMIWYKGFEATASRTICLVQVPNKSFIPANNNSVATFYFKSSNGMLKIRSSRLHNQYAIRHFMRLDGGQTGKKEFDLIASGRDMLELAPRAALFAATLRLPNNWGCVPRRTSNITAILKCTKAPPGDLTFKFHSLVILGLYGRVGTVKIDPKGTVYYNLIEKPGQILNTDGLGPRVGSITRPRLCIFPALILLLCIAVISLVMRIFTGSQDFAWKLWLFLSLSAGMSNKTTPFNTQCTEIDVMTGVTWRHEIVQGPFDSPQSNIEKRSRLHSDISENA